MSCRSTIGATLDPHAGVRDPLRGSCVMRHRQISNHHKTHLLEMCGIWAIFGSNKAAIQHVGGSFTKISHRGPDAMRIESNSIIKSSLLGFHRLAIIDSLYGMQPMRIHKYPHLILLCNGEIYNYQKAQDKYEYETSCDVEPILHSYQIHGADTTVRSLDGVFAFCLLDTEKKKILVARDPYGVRPLFKLYSDSGMLALCSESKGLMGLMETMNGDSGKLEPFLPGHYEEYSILENGSVELSKRVHYHKPGDKPSFHVYVPWERLSSPDVSENIRSLLHGAIKKRLIADRRIGCLLSGGLDSSLVAALVTKLAKENNFPYKIQTFSIGMGESPDVTAARQVANHIGSAHHEISFTQEDVAEVLDDVIYLLETCDITTVRASIGMYLVSRYIKQNTDTTVLFSGEGADEVAQGYIYFREAPSPKDAHDESARLLNDIYLYDGLRADRTISGHGLELRAPFLDLQFTNYYLSLDASTRQPQGGVEKYLLRTAFDNMNLLPKNILWRHKEAFSDGVASIKKSLFQVIQEIVEKRVTDNELEEAKVIYPHCTPKTKEALYYRKVFETHYKGQAEKFVPYFWMPRWVQGVTDPSARFIPHYAADD
ncbi:asparagine synthetase [glutamine-hydrolyzing] isoform X2 [Neodiprion lecontei]|uniref:Asparagine synthetase [glutamine-hydrolyzing] n=1 Tax=Neodiprion lecontei TaxID=441921 RepID=A0ABM3G1A4_NEOLC|nr:asparagine synthetase [glutamine-hydrolyzing] isoform X2 [Neodiprion lecontei]